MTEIHDHTPVRVHITGSDVQPAQLAGARFEITGRTIELTSASPYSDLVNYDPAREYMLLQVFGNDAVLCYSLGQAQDTANQTSGLPNPNGSLLTTGQLIPIRAINRLWVAAAAYPTQVSVIVAHRAT